MSQTLTHEEHKEEVEKEVLFFYRTHKIHSYWIIESGSSAAGILFL